MKMIIKLSENTLQRPFLKHSSKYSAKELSQTLLNTTYNGYNYSVEPLLTMGLAVMARFRKDLVKVNRGFPVAYLYGTTSAGKTNAINNIAYLFGFDENFICSGSSTILSMWEALDNYSCIPVIYDEISRKEILNSDFESFIKSAYQGTTRDKISKNIPKISATLILSSNFQPPQKPEILNRLLLCNFEQHNFDVKKVLNFNDTREKYLSNLLPAIVKFSSIKALDIYSKNRDKIKSLNDSIDQRSASNIAIAYTGYQILLEIAESELPEFVKDNFEKFVMNYVQSLRVASPWDEFKEALPSLALKKAIVAGRDYKYAYDKPASETESPRIHLLCLHFKTAYEAFVSYYRKLKGGFPPTEKEILQYAKNDPKVDSGKNQTTKGITLNKIKKSCLVIDVIDNETLSHLGEI